MKTILIALMLLIAHPTRSIANEVTIAENPETELQENKIYFFAHSMCHACKDAFIYFNTRHSELNIPLTDMKSHHNLELYKQCVKKFNIPNNELTLPLICMGNNYIMGWDHSAPNKFEKALREFNN